VRPKASHRDLAGQRHRNTRRGGDCRQERGADAQRGQYRQLVREDDGTGRKVGLRQGKIKGPKRDTAVDTLGLLLEYWSPTRRSMMRPQCTSFGGHWSARVLRGWKSCCGRKASTTTTGSTNGRKHNADESPGNWKSSVAARTLQDSYSCVDAELSSAPSPGSVVHAGCAKNTNVAPIPASACLG
jgi:hypothetical protein